ncbi:DUF6931 family protein [Simiduia aestuariiviva]|uniref:Uncharacterized protein n=1 Tax=Simiduia aestuariiviva TaxID=1510459 RepID=A0A839UKY6_9GAMM|nr:hypothetical protein [Simiduia aestuariiviva]MBB3168804.1 hypothetical protein [Simiduia aestuariiviva]
MKDWMKIKALTAGELLKEFELSDEDAVQCLVPGTAPRVSIENLTNAGHYLDAVKLLAHALPKREAVWWACLASRKVQTPDTDQPNVDALIAAEAWAKQPTEDNRLRARLLGKKTGHKTPASWAATAAAWSTGSLAEPGEPEIATPEYMYAHAVAGSVALAAVLSEPDDPTESYRLFLRQGFNLACGGNGILTAEELQYG